MPSPILFTVDWTDAQVGRAPELLDQDLSAWGRKVG